jgi:hypothetical protein
MAALLPDNAGRRQWLSIAIALGLLVLVLALGRRDRARLLAPPDALKEDTTSVALQDKLENQPPSSTAVAGGERQAAATTEHLRLYVSTGSYDASQARGMTKDLEQALGYVEERTGMHLARPVDVVFDRRAKACGPDAVAYTNVRTLILYACPSIPARRAVNILAHEFVHQLAHDRYGAPHHQADLILSEGTATWGAGRYWLGRYASFHDFVHAQYALRLLPLATDPHGGTSTATLNQLYYQWASYVEWLRANFGPAAFDRLYTTGDGRRLGSADYAGTLHMTFADTEARWRAWLAQPAKDE